MSDPVRTSDLSHDAADYMTGATRDTVNPTEGGTTRDGKVAVFGGTGTDSDTTSRKS